MAFAKKAMAARISSSLPFNTRVATTVHYAGLKFVANKLQCGRDTLLFHAWKEL